MTVSSQPLTSFWTNFWFYEYLAVWCLVFAVTALAIARRHFQPLSHRNVSLLILSNFSLIVQSLTLFVPYGDNCV